MIVIYDVRKMHVVLRLQRSSYGSVFVEAGKSPHWKESKLLRGSLSVSKSRKYAAHLGYSAMMDCNVVASRLVMTK